MSLQAQGIEATLESDGTLNIVSDKPLRVRLNGRVLNEAPKEQVRTPAQQFWTADGQQTDQRPVDLRGEIR